MGAPESIAIPTDVSPGEMIDISVNFIAPEKIGVYESIWLLQSPEGVMFGVGSSANQPVWTKVRVVLASQGITNTAPVPLETSISSPTPSTSLENPAYDFAGNACLAQWMNGDSLLPCPGLDGDSRGSILPVNEARMENGNAFQLPILLMLPPFSASGTIQGTYPDYEVQPGDHLQATVGCEAGATLCSVLFQVSYQNSLGVINDLWSIGEFYDGQLFNLDLDLAPIAGERVKFILEVSSIGDPEGDRALWVAPRIVQISVPENTPEGTITGTPTEAPFIATSTPVITPTAILINATPTQMAESGNQGSQSLFQQIIEMLISFFNMLFGN